MLNKMCAFSKQFKTTTIWKMKKPFNHAWFQLKKKKSEMDIKWSFYLYLNSTCVTYILTSLFFT